MIRAVPADAALLGGGLLVIVWNRRNDFCPFCHSPEISRSRRHGLMEQWLLVLTPLRPYRCGKCDKRHYARRLREVRTAERRSHAG
jgi:hypothetical protein